MRSAKPGPAGREDCIPFGCRARARLRPLRATGSSLPAQLTRRPILVDSPVARKREFSFSACTGLCWGGGRGSGREGFAERLRRKAPVRYSPSEGVIQFRVTASRPRRFPLLYRSLLGALMALLMGVGLGGSSGFAAERTTRRAPLGSVTATGPVWLNQPPGRESSGIPPGTALFAGDVIQTGKAGAALVRLLSGISASIAEQSSVTLLSGSGPAEQRGSHGIASIGQRGSHGMVSIEQRGSHGMVSMPWIRAEGAARSAAIPTLDLRQGALVALNGGPQPARVEIQGAAVILRGQPGLPAVSRVSVVGRSAAVFPTVAAWRSTAPAGP